MTKYTKAKTLQSSLYLNAMQCRVDEHFFYLDRKITENCKKIFAKALKKFVSRFLPKYFYLIFAMVLLKSFFKSRKY